MNRGLSSLMAVAIIATCLYELYLSMPILMPLLWVFSTTGLIIRVLQLRREHRGQTDPSVLIDFELCRNRDFRKHLGSIRQGLRGHDAAVARVVEQIQHGLAVAGPHRTLGAFLLVGPTGTGKTYLSELIAKALYPETEPIILRMNQYKGPQDVFTLIGPPPGYRGAEVGGALTRPMLENPYRVVILDEFDKAHPDVHDCLYDILDRAQCQEKSSGKTVHFSAAVFFATCNGSVDALRAVYGETNDPILRAGRAREALAREGFEKALLARFSDILLMDQLEPVEIAEVACLQLAKHWRQYGVEVTYAAPEVLLEALRRNVEFQDYGVRQLAHLIREFTTPSIEAARRQGAKQVRLDFDRLTGRLRIAS